MVINDDIHVGDVGTKIRVTVMSSGSAVNLASGSGVNQILFKKPNGVQVVKTATYYTNGQDGIIQYVTEAGFIDQPGTWYLTAAVNTSTWAGTASSDTFTVMPVFGT